MKYLIYTIIALVVALAISVTRCTNRAACEIVERCDTVVVVRVDTLRFVDVVYRDRVRVRVDTLRVFVEGDTVAVPVPIDRYTFTDDTTYRAQVSGWGVSLDRMEVFRRSVDRVVTVERTVVGKPRRFGLGVQVGYGITLDGRAQPYIGVGLSYNFIRF